MHKLPKIVLHSWNIQSYHVHSAILLAQTNLLASHLISPPYTTTMSFESPLPPYNASDPTATFLNSSCLDLLLIELVPLAYRTVHALDAPSSSSTNPSQSPKLEEDEERDRVFFRLESLGYRVGLGLVERFSKDRPRFTDTLDVIKFLCKDLWMLVFRKQIDNLKTNHRVSFLLCASHYLDVFNVMMQLLIQRNRVYMFLQIIHSAHLRA